MRVRKANKMKKINIRSITINDLDMVTSIEATCFPAAEAASKSSFRDRMTVYPEGFFVAELEGEMIGFINGALTNSMTIYDEQFTSMEHHTPDGENLAIFGLDVLADYQKRGFAGQLINHYIKFAKKQAYKRVILTCKKELVDYYAKFGFVKDGLSLSTHGGAEWFDMTLHL